MVAAGGELLLERWLRRSVGGVLAGLPDAAVRRAGRVERGDERLDLGPGVQPYKQRLANDEAAVRDIVLVPHGPSYPLARARLAPHQARWGISRRLSPKTKRRLRRRMRR